MGYDREDENGTTVDGRREWTINLALGDDGALSYGSNDFDAGNKEIDGGVSQDDLYT